MPDAGASLDALKEDLRDEETSLKFHESELRTAKRNNNDLAAENEERAIEAIKDRIKKIKEEIKAAGGGAESGPEPAAAAGAPAMADIEVPDDPPEKSHKFTTLAVILIIFVLATIVENTSIRFLLFSLAIFIFIAERSIYKKLAEKFGAGTGSVDASTFLKVGICIMIFFFVRSTYAIVMLIIAWLVVSTLFPPFVHIIVSWWKARRGEKKKEGDAAASMLSMAGPEGAMLGTLIKNKDTIMYMLLHRVAVVFGIFGCLFGAIFWGFWGFFTALMLAILLNSVIKLATGRTPLTPKAIMGLGITIMIVIVFTAPLTICPFVAGQESPVGRTCSSVERAKLFMENAISSLPEKVSTEFQKQKAIATGDYYTGQVDANAEKTLGVFLEDIKQADPRFYQDLPITMFATLRAQTLDETINITVNCSSKGATEPPKIFPDPPKFTVDVYEERDIDCSFPAGSLGSGVKQVEFSAAFSFKTMAYIKAYFMDQNTLRSLRRENIDPLDQYGITDKSPSTIYTAGPVGVGMKVENPPIGIDREADQRITTLGITLDNKWDGEISSIEDFSLIVPAGFELVDMGGSENFERITCGDLQEKVSGCNDDLFNIYRFDPDMKAVKKGEFKTFRGHLRSSISDYEKILGASPVATHYFKATLRYSYSLIKQKSVEITPTTISGAGGSGGGVDLTAPQATITSAEPEPTKIKFVWETNEPSIDTLVYWLASDQSKQNVWQAPQPETDYSRTHETTAFGLSPGTEYFYQIITRDAAGNVKTHPAAKIKTSPQNATGG